MKLDVRVVLLGAATLSLVAFLSLSRHQKSAHQVRSQFAEYQYLVTRQIAAEIESYLRARSSGLLALSGLPDVQDADTDRVAIEFASFVRSVRYVSSLSLHNTTGGIVQAAPSGAAGPAALDAVALAWATDPASRGKVLILPIPPDSSLQARSEFAVLMVTPVYRDASSGRRLNSRGLVGVLSLIVRLGQQLSIQLASVSAAPLHYHLWIVDEEGRLLFQSEHPEMVGRRVSDTNETCSACHTSFSQVQHVLREKQGAMDYAVGKSPAKVAAFAAVKLESADWVVVVNAPSDAVTRAVREDSYHVLLLLAVMAVILVGGTAVLARSQHLRLMAEEQAGEWQLKHGLEERIRESEERYRTIIETAHDLIWALDAEGRLTLANSRAAQVTGYNISDYVGQRFGPHIVPEDLQATEEVFQSVMAGQTRSYDVGLVAADGRILRLSVDVVPLKDGERVVGCVSFASDVTEKRRAEEELRRSESRYRALSEGSFEGIVVHEKGRILDVNPSFGRLLGCECSDLVGTPALNLVPLECRETVGQRIVSDSEEAYETVVLRRDGSSLPAEVHSRPFDYEGRTVRVAAVRDITDRKRAEEELRETRDFLENLVNHANAPIIVWDPAHRVTRFNHAFEVLTGYASDEVIGKALDVLFPDQSRDKSLAEINRTLSGQRWESVEIPICRKDGAVRIALWNSANLYGRDGVTLMGTIAQGQDITERKQAEEELRKGAQHWQDTFDAIDHTVAIIDRDYTIVKANRAMRLEFAGREVVGERCYRLIHGTDQPPERCQSCKVFSTGVGEHFELLEPHLGGRWLDISAYPVRQENGVVREMVHVSRDITEHKLLEQRFLQAQKMEAIGRLAGGVAHDFNNILTVIVGYSDFALQSLPAGSTLHDDMKEIRQAADRAGNLTRQLLAFSRQQVIAPRLVNLGDLALNLDNMLRRLIGEDIQLVILPEAGLWPVKLDPGQFEHVLVNLAVNARDAMPHGGTLTMRVANIAPGAARAPRFPEDADPDTCYVLLEVNDTGEGMTEEVKEHLFEPFFTTKATGKGTGLGLATCYGIVKQNNGLILVDSLTGRGSAFRILLPRSEEEGPGGSFGEAEASSASLTGSETILLVEDEPAVRGFAARALRDRGYTVLEARDGEDALHAAWSFGERPIDIVVTDVVMPRLGGWELVERIRVSRPDVKVLFVSGYTGDGLLSHGVLESGSRILQKPFSPEALVRSVRDVLDAIDDVRQGA